MSEPTQYAFMESIRISAFVDPNFYEVENKASLRLTVHLSEGSRNVLRKWKKHLSLSVKFQSINLRCSRSYVFMSKWKSHPTLSAEMLDNGWLVNYLTTQLTLADVYLWFIQLQRQSLRINYTDYKSGFLDLVQSLYFNKITMFRKLDLLPSSGKKEGQKP
jgi:hypothetical protein